MKRIFLTLIALVTLASCSEYQRVLKKDNTKAKYDLAEKLYKEEDFKRSNRLFEQIHKQYIGKPQGQRIFYFYANTFYQLEDYYSAAYQFDRFSKSYPKSDKAEEASFLGAKSQYLLSPKYSIDQTETDTGIEKVQLFINSYPDSKFMAEANKMAKELTTKKELKAIEIAKQYLKLGDYNLTNIKASVAAMDSFISDFPGSIYREDALYYRLKAGFELANVSIYSKVKERLELANEYYSSFNKYFPESKYKKDADKMFANINEQLQQFSK